MYRIKIEIKMIYPNDTIDCQIDCIGKKVGYDKKAWRKGLNEGLKWG